MGFQIIKPNTKYDIIGLRKIAFMLSGILIFIGLASLVVKGGPKYGIDFAGGIVVQVKFNEDVKVQEIKSSLAPLSLPGLVVQRFGDKGANEFLLRTSQGTIKAEDIRLQVTDALAKGFDKTGFEIQRLEMVGPKVGADLRSKALEALFYAVLLIAIYISGRFEQRWMTAGIMAGGLAAGIYVLQLLNMPTTYLIIGALFITIALCWYLKLTYALGAVVALIHDLMITVGIFSLLDKDFDLTIVAALLTILGYSLNDTIIVFDRIRENIHAKTSKDLGETINTSINQTLSRTLLTSGTTLLVVLALYFFGGGVIHDFAFALLIGVVVGTYSSIYVASPILLGFSKPDQNARDHEPAAVPAAS
ncbi:MAG: protein translocase subunit SecF [Desulfoplanes sp.]